MSARALKTAAKSTPKPVPKVNAAAYRRQEAEECEQSVCAILSGKRSRLKPDHPWYGHDKALAKAILADHLDLASAEHCGRTHDDSGDIRVHRYGRKREPLQVEIKVSKTGAAKGTLANLSQDLLTAIGALDGLEDWSGWRARRGHDERICRILDQYPKARKLSRKEDKGRCVRDDAKRGVVLAKRVQADAHAFADQECARYVKLLLGADQDQEVLRRLVVALLTGQRRLKDLKAFVGRRVDEKDLRRLLKENPVYWTNVRHGQIVVSRSTGATALTALRAQRLRVEPSPKGRDLLLRAYDGQAWVTLMRLRHHWKNVFLGIETPCTMVFGA